MKATDPREQASRPARFSAFPAPEPEFCRLAGCVVHGRHLDHFHRAREPLLRRCAVGPLLPRQGER
ncbi:hypothetical protein SLG_36370 [Sphingobium sp. SYK-6]|nr:hypothetical protein SLG_36370 [Sphingobium sp. SYK-6]